MYFIKTLEVYFRKNLTWKFYFNATKKFTLSETHVDKSDVESLYKIPGFTFENRPRLSGDGGGVAAYISNNIKWERRQDLEDKNIECLWLEIFPPKTKSYYLCVMYRPPDTSDYLPSNFNEVFTNMLSVATKDSKECILIGDVNVNFLNNDNKEFKKVLTLFGFKQLITKPTRYNENNATLIDIIASNNSVHIPSTEVIPMSLSDHEMIGFTRKLNNYKYTPQKINCRDYRNYDPERMRNELKGIDWNNMYEIKDVNKAWTYLQTNLQTTFDSHAPVISKVVKGRPSPWLIVVIKHQMNIRDQLYRKWKK